MSILNKQKELYKNMRALTIDCKKFYENANNLINKIEEIDNIVMSENLATTEIKSWKEFITNSEYKKIKRLCLVLQYIEQPDDPTISNTLLNDVLNATMIKKK